MMEITGSGQSNDPQANHQGANGEDPVARMAILGGEGRGFAGAEDLAANADGHEQCAEDEGNPSHGFIVLPWQM